MKALHDLLSRIRPLFKKGGRLSMFHSTFDAFDTFLFVPGKVTTAGAHIRDAIDLKRTMSVVIMALMPALLFGMWNVGYQRSLSIGVEWSLLQNFWYGFLVVLPIIIVSYVSGLAVEFIFAQIKGHEVNEGFLVSGMLIPLIMPPDVPLWMVAVATVFAVVLGKEVFGGTGMNIVNPALLARAFIFFAYPAYISGSQVWTAGLMEGQGVIDGFSGATPLAHAAAGEMDKIPALADLFFGFIPGSIGETSKLAILLGAAILLFTGVGSWRIMLMTVVGGILTTLLFNAIGMNAYMELSPLTQLMMGGFLFGAVFMATDPVTATQTIRGQYYYGFFVGVFAILIRVLNPAYPEGMMLAILLMNVVAPLIDHYIIQANIRRRLKRATIKLKA